MEYFPTYRVGLGGNKQIHAFHCHLSSGPTKGGFLERVTALTTTPRKKHMNPRALSVRGEGERQGDCPRPEESRTTSSDVTDAFDGPPACSPGFLICKWRVCPSGSALRRDPEQ